MFHKLLRVLFPFLHPRHHDTIRYAFPFVFITALIAGLASVVTENNSYVTVRTNLEQVDTDTEFFIDVSVTAHVPVNAVDIVVSYPDDRIRIEGIDTGTSVITLWTEEPYAKDGNIYLRGGTFRKGFLGEHVVARIRAKALYAGEARMLVKETQLVAGDGKGSAVAAGDAVNEARIIVSAVDGKIEGKATVSLVTDTDGDGDVDLGDISRFMSAWLTRGQTYDFNGDGRMTFVDFSILLAESFSN